MPYNQAFLDTIVGTIFAGHIGETYYEKLVVTAATLKPDGAIVFKFAGFAGEYPLGSFVRHEPNRKLTDAEKAIIETMKKGNEELMDDAVRELIDLNDDELAARLCVNKLENPSPNNNVHGYVWFTIKAVRAIDRLRHRRRNNAN